MSEDVIDVEDARALVGKHEVLVIDIRSEDDFAAVRINGSKRADPDDVEQAIEEADATPERVMLVCADGSKSGDLAGRLSSDGREVTSLDGGIEAWEGAGYPVAPRPDDEYEGPPVKMPGAVASEGPPEEKEEGGSADTSDEGDEQVDDAADAEATRGD